MNLVNKTVKGISKLKKERNEWIKKYEDIVNNYKFMIEQAERKAEEAALLVKEDKKEHEKLKNDILELTKTLNDFYNEYQKRSGNIEKIQKDLIDARKEFLLRFERQEKINTSLKEEMRLIKDQLKRIEGWQEKNEKALQKLESSIKEFRGYIIDHMNSANIEYERRFEKFKEKYENAIEISNQLNKELKKIESIQRVLESFHKRILNLETRLDKAFNSLNVSEKRIDQVRKEKELLNDKMFHLKEEIYYKIRELEDAILLVENRMKENH
jgi:chromosome segregation ATPase